MNKIYNGVASEYDFPKYENKMPLKVHPETIIDIDKLLKEKDKEIDRLNKDIRTLQNMLIESQALCDEYIEKYNNLKELKENK